MMGWIAARVVDARFESVTDHRRPKRGSWSLASILSTAVVGLIAECHSVAELEELTTDISAAARRLLRLRGRFPDTTARDVLVGVDPEEVRRALYRQVRTLERRKVLVPAVLPWGVVSMDGKATTITSWDGLYAQQQGHRGSVRTLTATLVSSDVRACLDAHPIPVSTNEMGAYLPALDRLLGAYQSLDLFRVVMYDAGACSEANARGTRERGLDYVMVLNQSQPTLFDEAKRLDMGAGTVVEDDQKRVRYTLWASEELAGYLDWSHLKTVLRVAREELDGHGRTTSVGERYFVTSKRRDALTMRQWATLLRARWGVENNCHHTFDTAFLEDARPWFQASPRGALNIILLRRIAYNMLAAFRSHTLRTENPKLLSWRYLMKQAHNALIAATEPMLAGLRARPP
jgi:hypothetical protein